MAADISNDRAVGGNLRCSFRRKARTSAGKILRIRCLRTPTENAIRYQADMAILLQQDLANIEAGLYPLPADHDGSLLTLLHSFTARRFFLRISPKSIGAARASSVNCITTNAMPRFSLTDITTQALFMRRGRLRLRRQCNPSRGCRTRSAKAPPHKNCCPGVAANLHINGCTGV
jgi:hypothetical protein